MNKGKLYIVATPIGNLGDISQRALDILHEVDAIYCEDTRVTSKLLSYFNIQKTLQSYHQHSEDKKAHEILDQLNYGKDLALVTDAGTPGISDPGGKLVEFLSYENIEMIPIPGASAVVTALSACGFPAEKFLFLGFPPHKSKRKKFFTEVAENKYTTVFYESPYRIHKALKNLKEVLGEDRQICICRELTKKFETIYRGTIEEIIAQDIPARGEFVVVVRK
ncbi:MAG: 16S rRNA (cytidine(1402)-2'-O)-methyltransferase [Candidatus Magasanikbacteria bacterium]|nr:16S rRNA (cytidine(1402)-2'-O)-methyltransferase [Candidatus Magasanikbacteria bacterium]